MNASNHHRDQSAGFPRGEHGPSPPTACPGLVCMANVKPKQIEWLWDNRIAIGKLTVMAGDPGVGKSTATLDIAAKVTQGSPWPNTPDTWNQPGSVILLSAEDGLDDTIQPRLAAAGADLARVFALTPARDPKDQLIRYNLKDEITRLADAIQSLGDVRLVVIDLISAYLGEIDEHGNGEVRNFIAPLAEMAERTKVAVILVHHLNKNMASKALYRVLGSIGLIAAARSGFIVCEDPNNPSRRYMLRVKNNLSSEMRGHAFKIEDGAVVWETTTVNLTADQLLAQHQQANKPETQTDRATQLLVRLLSDGPKSVQAITEAADAEGLSKYAINRASYRLKMYEAKIRLQRGPLDMETPGGQARRDRRSRAQGDRLLWLL